MKNKNKNSRWQLKVATQNGNSKWQFKATAQNGNSKWQLKVTAQDNNSPVEWQPGVVESESHKRQKEVELLVQLGLSVSDVHLKK